MIKRATMVWVSMILPFMLFAQSSDFYTQAGKIYVVVAVLAAILIGIFVLLFYMERRLRKLEQEASNQA
ncbi:MAG: CcmD family protein [Bacteroidota bacterium]